jgi:hypothetical protein
MKILKKEKTVKKTEINNNKKRNCMGCREQHKKCDKNKPSCGNCKKR